MFLDCVHLSIGKNVGGQWGITGTRYQPYLNLGKLYLEDICVLQKYFPPVFQEEPDSLFLVDS